MLVFPFSSAVSNCYVLRKSLEELRDSSGVLIYESQIECKAAIAYITVLYNCLVIAPGDNCYVEQLFSTATTYFLCWASPSICGAKI